MNKPNNSALTHIIVKGARQHNLKNIDLEIPKNKMVIFTGVSGSGKSSMAMDTIYAEGQRRYVESLSSYARQFLGVMDKPDVDSIEGLSPAIAIDQKTTSKNPRSTVGTITEVYDFMRLLYARVGHPHCPNCGREVQRQSSEEIVNQIFSLAESDTNFKSERGSRFIIYSPIVRDRKGEFSSLFDNLKKQGVVRARIDGKVYELSEQLTLIKTNKHTIDAFLSRHIISKKRLADDEKNIRSTIFQSIETALRMSNGLALVSFIKDKDFDFSENPKEVEDHLFSENFACPFCNISLPDIEPRSFSFNSPHGACAECDGLGTKLVIDESTVLNKSLTIKEGAILPWNKLFEHNSWTQLVIDAVAKEHNIPLNIEVSKMTKEHMDIVLYGTGDVKHKINYTNKEGDMHNFNARYEGVIPNLLRRHKETQSDYVRNEIEKYMVLYPCSVCNGDRLNKHALSVVIDSQNIAQISNLSIEHAVTWFNEITTKFNLREQTIAEPIMKEINYRMKFLLDVGLGYLTLSRASSHLSGGEAQRIRLASQIGSGLSGVLYVLDEPSIGLHQRDQGKLIKTLHHLRDLGNTVLVVEHDEETMLQSDYIFDFGPGAGEHGGKVIAEGTPAQLMKDANSLTGKYLSRRLVVGQTDVISKKKSKKKFEFDDGFIDAEISVKDVKGRSLSIIGASGRNLKNIDVEIPLGKLVCVTGVSGSGKSTLIMDTLHRALRQRFALKNEERPEPFRDMTGLEHIDKVIAIDQTPIGRTPKSNPATYTKVFDLIRELFAQTQDSKIRGYKAGRFSFNVKGGRCEACSGEGQVKIEMQFMPDVYINCEVCEGKRYNKEALEIHFRGKNIADVLDMTIEEALEFFANHENIRRKIQVLYDVGLSYIRLGQPAPTLSGGEAQRVKLALELAKRSFGSTLYILDEPTTGLHFADLENLITIMKILTRRGNTVLVIEHNLDIIANSDWIIDLGPEGGDKGGELVFSGDLKALLSCKYSHTATALREIQQKPLTQ